MSQLVVFFCVLFTTSINGQRARINGDKGNIYLTAPQDLHFQAGKIFFNDAVVPDDLTQLKGEPGSQGLPGQKGENGAAGAQGQSGSIGKPGSDGRDGRTGLTGSQGTKGDKGDVGIQGPKGTTGSTGTSGTAGAKGDKGVAGIQGPAGSQGLRGLGGDKGDTGSKGDVGNPGINADNTKLSALLDATMKGLQALESRVQALEPPPKFGSGKDGTLVVASGKTQTTKCAYLTASVAAGTSVLSVSDCSQFTAGDEILIHQTQHPSQAGDYEFGFVKTCTSNKLQVVKSVQKPYDSATYGGRNPKVAQVIKVPNYVAVTIAGTLQPPTWDGKCGGIIAMRANQTVTVSGTISVTGKGFRGSPKYDSGRDYVHGYVGESEKVGYQVIRQSGAIGSGGGGGNGQGGGYGGAHKTAGSVPERGGCDVGGAGRPSTVGFADFSFVFFGGSGGASGSHGSGTRDGAEGGTSAGIVLIYSNGVVSVTGKINARGSGGTNGYKSSQGQPIGGGGGGAGGAVLIHSAKAFTQSGNVVVSGGAGGQRALASGCNPGGAGGSGGTGWFIIIRE